MTTIDPCGNSRASLDRRGGSRYFATMRFRTVLASALAILPLGCGGAPPAATPAAPAGAVAAKGDKTPRPPVEPIDVSAVAAPPALKVVVTVKNAEALQKSARDLFGPVFPLVKSITADAAAQVFLGAALADVVDLNKPIDAGILDSNEAFAVSFALSSIEDARQNLAEDFDLVDREAGVVALVPHKDADPSKLRCEIRPAAGDAPYRLVCASHATTLKTLAPYLVRTIPRDTAPDDVRIRVFSAAMTANLDPDDAKDPTEAAMRRMALDSLTDAEAFTLDATLGANGVDVSGRSTFRSTLSPLTRIELTHARDPRPLPDLFWRLPADSLGAAYAKGADVADLAPLRDLLLAAFDDGFAKDGAPDEVVQKLNKLFSSVLLTGGPISAAYGYDIPGIIAAISSSTPKHPVGRTPLHGWVLLGLEEPSSRWIDAFHGALAIDRIPWKKTAAALEKEKKDTSDTELVERPITDKKLPPHSGHFAFQDYPKKNGKRGSAPTSTFHVYVIPDGNRTWLAMGENEPLVVARAKAAVAGVPATGLASRTDLEALRAPSGFAGFVTPALFDVAGGPSDGTDATKTRDFLDQLKASPDTETTPIVFFVPGSSGPTQGVDLHVRASNDVTRGLLSRAK